MKTNREASSRQRPAAIAAAFACVLMFATVGASSPARAADPATMLPGVTVSAKRNPGETPVEAAYTTAMASRLEKSANYPTSREASVGCPSGTSTVWVDLSRAGKVVGHGVENGSGSQILDQHAVVLATRAKYPALPTDAWTDGAKHRFVVGYAFDCSTAKAQKPASKAK